MCCAIAYAYGHRTFDRYITEDFATTLQKDHPNAAFYYNGVPPMLFERYWGSKESYNQWGMRHVRIISSVDDDDDEPELDRRRRLQSESATSSFTNSSSSILRSTMANVAETPSGPMQGMARERRSKSTAYINSKKHTGTLSTAPQVPSSQATNSGGGDETLQYGRSPRTWIQKFEDWHRELKTQKEKKKAEKRRHKLDSRGDSALASTSAVSRSSQKERESTSRRPRKSFSSSPSRSHSLDHGKSARCGSDGSDGAHSPMDRRAASMGPRTKEPTDVPLSRSFSDPFRSPDGVLDRSPWHHPAKLDLPDDIDSQILIRSLDRHTRGFEREERAAKHAERDRKSRREPHHQPQKHPLSSRTRNGSIAETTMPRTGSFQYPQRQSASMLGSGGKTASGAYASAAAPVVGRQSEGVRHPSDMRRPPRQYPKASSSSSSSSNPYDGELSLSPAFSQLRSSELLNGVDYDVMRSPYAQPGIRRNASLPDSQPPQHHPPLSATALKRMPRVMAGKRPAPAESARVIRDRAHVVSYMQRKLSDASSLAGSISRSPREHHLRTDTSRLSASSSNSSRASDQVFGSQRSGVLALPYRKGSFSFFDKLSSDLESHLGDINRSYPSSEVDFGASVQSDTEDVGSMTLPLPAKGRSAALEEFRRRSSFTFSGSNARRRSFVRGKE